MATLNDIVSRFKTLVSSQAGIQTALFDDLSAVNGLHATKYPLALLEPPTGSIGGLIGGRAINLVSNMAVPTDFVFNVYVMDLYSQQQEKETTVESKFTTLLSELATLIKAMPNDNMKLAQESITINMDRFAQNDRLIFVQASITIKVQECY